MRRYAILILPPWKLWLDDQIRDPECPNRHPPEGFVGAASTTEAIQLVLDLGPPIFIDFDHDLGGEDTAKVFLKWLEEHYPDSPPEDWNVHSANNQAKPWIDSFLRSWKKSLGGV